MVWVAVVEAGMPAMEDSHKSFVWRVVWIAVVEAGMAAIEGSHGQVVVVPMCYCY